MKKLATFLTMMSVAVLFSAIPAISSSGPFGTFGPHDGTIKGKVNESHRISNVGGTGPYGAFVNLGTERGELSKRPATPGGTGPYGAFDTSGMLPGIGSTYKNECIVTAKNCPTDR